jgi:diguanylate cyclase (GGDEF)-like protein
MEIVAIVIPTLALVFTAGFVSLWLRDRTRRHVFAFAIGYFALALCYAINLMPHTLDAPLAGALMHSIALFSAGAVVWGAGRRIGRDVPVAFMVVNTLASAFLLFEAIRQSHPTAIVVVQNASAALQFAIGATVLWAAHPREWLDRAVVWIMGAIAAVGLLRPAIAMLAEGDLSALIGRTSAFHGIQVVAMTVLPVLLGMVLMALVLFDEWSRQKKAARNDVLAGLRGRAAFEEDARAALQKASCEGLPVSLILGDIDHFKRINDGWGHATGDMVIGNVGRTIARMTRDSDIAGRVGGEEFCILLWNCPLHTAARSAERLRRAMADREGTGAGGGGLEVTMSFGVAQFREGESYAALFERADASLYRAKDLGRNRVILDGRTFEEADRRRPAEPVIPVHG